MAELVTMYLCEGIYYFHAYSHFHLDHCGALPYFTEMCGYDGPILMTHPTKAISPILLVSYLKFLNDAF